MLPFRLVTRRSPRAFGLLLLAGAAGTAAAQVGAGACRVTTLAAAANMSDRNDGIFHDGNTTASGDCRLGLGWVAVRGKRAKFGGGMHPLRGSRTEGYR